MATVQVTVAPLNSADSSTVRKLLVAGLTERWGTYNAALNPDIEAFPGSYGDAVVMVAKQAGVVVGTGTLRIINAGQAEVVRMSVAAAARRAGVGSLILSNLLRLAQEQGAHEVILETTSSWSSAVKFYTRHGFVKTHEQDGNSYFCLKPSEA
jgi:ribosomal protein S18 acetylase RimI-like enzyme